MPLKNEIRVDRAKRSATTTADEVRELLRYEPSTGLDHNKTFPTIEDAVAHAHTLRQQLHGEYARDGLS